MASQKYKQYSVLASSTLAFTVCFMVWMMLAVAPATAAVVVE